MKRTVAVFGGNFNPPGLRHRRIAEELTRNFDEVVIVPCGPRPDKIVTNDIDPLYRAALTTIAFRGVKGIEIDHFDLEQESFTRTCELEMRYGGRGEVWHVIGSDLIEGGKEGKSTIQRYWEK